MPKHTIFVKQMQLLKRNLSKQTIDKNSLNVSVDSGYDRDV